jgi:hypothetical protein
MKINSQDDDVQETLKNTIEVIKEHEPRLLRKFFKFVGEKSLELAGNSIYIAISNALPK